MIVQGADMDVVLVLGAFAGMLLAFYKMIGAKDTQSAADREADRKERKELTDAIHKMARSSQDVAIATKKSASEAKERNGHLGEQNVHIASLISSQNEDIHRVRNSNKRIADILSKSALIAAEDRDALLTPEQHIDTQIVEHQEVRGE